MKNIIRKISIVLTFTIPLAVLSQNKDILKYDNQLTLDFQKMMNAELYVRYDSLGPLFKNNLNDVLKRKNAMDYPFKNLNEEIKIIYSKDKKLRFFSWNEKTGGSWNNIAVIAQFRTTNENCDIKIISNGNQIETGEFTDAVIYKIHEFKINGIKHYLTFGWGSHGGGNHHEIVQIFKFEKNKLIKCKTCFEEGTDIVIQASRTNKINLEFDINRLELKTNEFILNEQFDRYEQTGKEIKWVLKDNKFEKTKN